MCRLTTELHRTSRGALEHPRCIFHCRAIPSKHKPEEDAEPAHALLWGALGWHPAVRPELAGLESVDGL